MRLAEFEASIFKKLLTIRFTVRSQYSDPTLSRERCRYWAAYLVDNPALFRALAVTGDDKFVECFLVALERHAHSLRRSFVHQGRLRKGPGLFNSPDDTGFYCWRTDKISSKAGPIILADLLEDTEAIAQDLRDILQCSPNGDVHAE